MAASYRSRHPLISFRKSKIEGTGGFAKVAMRRGKRIVEYDGPRISQEEAQALIDQGNAYILTLHDDAAPWIAWG